MRGTAATFASIGVLRGRAAAAAEFTYKYGHNLTVDSPLHVRMVQMWKAVEQETHGRLVVEIFPSNVLGGDTAMVSQLRSGALQLQSTAGLVISIVVPVAAIEMVPFAFKDRNAAWAAMDGSLGAYVRQALEAKGIHAFPKFYELGFLQVTNNVHPIRVPEDFTGIKIRAAAAKLGLDTFQGLGAATMPLDLAQTYTALQNHVADGEYNSYGMIEFMKFFEVQKYASQLNLCWADQILMMNGDAWKALPPDIQDVVTRNQAKYALLQRRDMDLLNDAASDKLQRQGMVVNVVSDLAPFRAKLSSSGFYDHWRQEFGPAAWSILEQYSGKLT